MFTVVIIGARRSRQGIGEFIARAFASSGAEVRGIVGTREESVAQARRSLHDRYGLTCNGYLSVEAALEQEKPDIVALCSPIAVHRRHLELTALAGAHCLCEKPLWWEQIADRETRTAALVDMFHRSGRYLGLVTQWPCTLGAFFELHPELEGERIDRFEMVLSPITKGAGMVIDSISHPLSMLEALAGPGEVESPDAVFVNRNRGHLRLRFSYLHPGGAIQVVCRFITKIEPPRPAGYIINGLGVERQIRLPSYRIFFEAAGRSVEVEDPIHLLVRDFLGKVRIGAAVDREGLIRGMRSLERLVTAVEAAQKRTNP